MIIQTEKEQIVTNLKSETRQYTIASSPKAFSVLMDKLYSDKIQSIVRELTSNAYDAHLEAKKLKKPFEVTCPTSLAPTFAIRDYGHSMDHDFVMRLYSSVFYSSKEDTNNQVGTFGLGSKSPFAYADGFNLATFRKGKVSLYSAFYDEDRVPSIVHLDTKDTQEPDGTYVSFQVSIKDIAAFQKAIEYVYKAYWRTPFKLINLEAPKLIKPSKLLGLDYVHTPPADMWNNTRVFSQGNVWYNVPERFISGYSKEHQPGDQVLDWVSGIGLVLEVPIGTFNITPSREAISLDNHSVVNINAFLKKTREDLTEKVAELYKNCKTRLDYYEVWRGLQKTPAQNLSGYTLTTFKGDKISVNQMFTAPDHLRGPKPTHPILTENELKFDALKPGFLYEMWKANTYRAASVTGTLSLPQFKLYSGLEHKMLRKTMRLRSVNNSYVYYCFSQDLPRFVRILGLKPSHIFSISEIPDPGPPITIKTPVAATAQPIFAPEVAFFVGTSRDLVSAKDPFINQKFTNNYYNTMIRKDDISYFLSSLKTSIISFDPVIADRISKIQLHNLYFGSYAGDDKQHLYNVLLNIFGGEDNLVAHMSCAGIGNKHAPRLDFEGGRQHPLQEVYSHLVSNTKPSEHRVNIYINSAWQRWPFKELNDRIKKEIPVVEQEYDKAIESVKKDYKIFSVNNHKELFTKLEVFKCKTSNT